MSRPTSYHSKYRGMRLMKTADESHISQVPFKYSQCDFLRLSPKYISIPLENNNIGVYPLNFCGVVPQTQPRIYHAHIKRILDMTWSPFDFGLLASCSIDGLTKLWSIPEEFEADIKDPNVVLNCEKKVCTVRFHPTCPTLLATGGVSKKTQLWDIEKGEAVITTPMKDAPLSQDFSSSGDVLFVCTRDKKLRMLDVRAPEPVKQEVNCFGSVKGINVIYMKDKDWVVTSGFERDGRRGIRLYDPKKMDKEIQKLMVRDQSSGVLVSMYDHDLGILYVAGRGEENITFYDHETGVFREIGAHRERDAHLGIELVPKIALNTMKHEIGRFFKFTPKKKITPLRIIFPKMSKTFQADLFPDTSGFKPTATLEEFMGGGELKPVEKITLDPEKREKETTFWTQERDEKY